MKQASSPITKRVIYLFTFITICNAILKCLEVLQKRLQYWVSLDPLEIKSESFVCLLRNLETPFDTSVDA